MSNVSLAFDAARTAIGTLFPNMTELPNPYSVEDNNQMLLENGWGLKFGASTVSPFEVLKETTSIIEFVVVLSTQIIRLDSDVEAIHTQMKALFEDEVTLRKDFLNPDQLQAQPNIRKIEWTSTSEPLEIQVSRFNFKYIEVNFSFDLAENI